MKEHFGLGYGTGLSYRIEQWSRRRIGVGSGKKLPSHWLTCTTNINLWFRVRSVIARM